MASYQKNSEDGTEFEESVPRSGSPGDVSVAKIVAVRIRNYRSVSERVELRFPPGHPVVLIGENNSGKSNLVGALQLILGPFYAGNYDPEDHEFFGRDRSLPIEIEVAFAPEAHLGRYQAITWRYDEAGAEQPTTFRGSGLYGQGFVKNEERDACTCIILEAERKLQYQLGYTSKWTYLSRLMRRFHRSLQENPAVRGELEELFEKTKEKFGELPEFAEFRRELQTQLSDLVGSMTHRLEVDFEAYNPTNFFHALDLHAAEGTEPRTLAEMGTGEQQVLAMAFAYAYAKAFHGGMLLIIEEPEAHLHPLAQQWLARKLQAMTDAGLQVVLTTHSPAFIDPLRLEGLVHVRKEGGSTRVTQIDRDALVRHCEATGVPSGTVTRENVLPLYAAHATKEILEGFFAKVVVLVEGPTEGLALPIHFRRCGLDVTKEGVAIIPVHGKGNLAKWYRLFTAYGIPVYVAFDNDVSDDPEGRKREGTLAALGIAPPEHGRYTRTAEWIIEPSLCVFGEDFETCLRRHYDRYAALEEEARQVIGAKPFVAKRVAEQLPMEDRGWERMAALKDAIRNKLPQ